MFLVGVGLHTGVLPLSLSVKITKAEVQNFISAVVIKFTVYIAVSTVPWWIVNELHFLHWPFWKKQ